MLTDSDSVLLDSLMPRDLRTMHNDLLILTAAFEGNVHRYAWLDCNPDTMYLVYTV